QRIAIARAAIRRASILILDEPTTGLDRENEQAVIQALERLAQGRTTFLVTHALDLAARADQILYLEGGRIVERGTHAELLCANARYAALQRLHALRHERGMHDKEPTDLIALATHAVSCRCTIRATRFGSARPGYHAGSGGVRRRVDFVHSRH